MIFVSSLGYHVTIMLLKLTFLLQFRRVFPLPAFQRLCDMFMIFLAAWTVAGIVGGVAICLPFEKNWDPQDRAWLCEKRFWFWLGHGIVHVVTDVVLCIMPLPLLRTLPLPPVQKVVLIGIFCLGFVYVLLLAYGDLWLGKASNLGAALALYPRSDSPPFTPLFKARTSVGPRQRRCSGQSAK